MRELHILAGVLVLLAGAMALSASKGSPLHRRSGSVFAYAMFAMTGSAVLIATTSHPNPGNVVAGVLAFYLVASSLLTVKPDVPQARALLAGLMLVAIAVSIAATALGFAAMQRPNGHIDGIPGPPLLLFAAIALIAALMDARLLRLGRLEGKHRIARHLWRMTYAMWMATTSAFIGQAKFIPEPLRHWGLLVLPPLLVLVALIYWLIKVLRGRRVPAPSKATLAQAERVGATS
jgi:hypothetical protein